MVYKFNIGDFVWAKMKGFHAWPARISDPESDPMPGSEKKPKLYVYFYGSDNYAWILQDQIWPYNEFKSTYMITHRVPPGFAEAIEEIEQEILEEPVKETPPVLSEESELNAVSEESPNLIPEITTETITMPDIHTATPRPKREAHLTQSHSAKKSRTSVEKKEATVTLSAKKKSKKTSQASHHTEELQPLRLPDILSMSPSALDPCSESLSLKIGFLGLGIMGASIANAMLQAGLSVTVWNRTPSKCRDFVAQGALKGISAADVIQSCDITFSCVSDSCALKELVSGDCGVLAAIKPGKAFVDLSSVDIETIVGLYEAVTIRGGRFLEAPLVGTLQQQNDDCRTSIVLAAGDSSLYEDCLPCFGTFARKTFFIGEVGSATSMKLVLNTLYGSMLAGLAETLALGEKVGLQQQQILDILALLPIASPLIASKGEAMINSKFNPPQLSLEHMQRGLRMALSIAEPVQQPVLVVSAVNELFKKAKARGYGDHDSSAIFRATD